MDKLFTIHLLLIILLLQGSKINTQILENDFVIYDFTKELIKSNNYKFLTTNSKIEIGDKFLSPRILFNYDGGQHVARECKGRSGSFGCNPGYIEESCKRFQ